MQRLFIKMNGKMLPVQTIMFNPLSWVASVEGFDLPFRSTHETELVLVDEDEDRGDVDSLFRKEGMTPSTGEEHLD